MAVLAETLPTLPATIKAHDRPIVVYEQAVRAVQACSTVLEAKLWNDKAEALAAWAKIYADDRVEQEARALKLHAYRQIGRLADQMRQHTMVGDGGYRTAKGSTKGARSVLMEHGINAAKAQHMITVSRIPEPTFNKFVNRPKPPSPSYLVTRELGPNPSWSKFRGRLSVFLSAARHADFDELVTGLDEKQLAVAKKLTKESMDFLGDLAERLWKVDRGKSVTRPG